MLIVFSGNTSWSMYNFRIGLVKKFLESGYDVCIVAPEDDYTQKINDAGIPFVGIKNLKRAGTNPVEDYMLYKEYKRVYSKLKPDFVFHYTIKPNNYGTLACKKLHIPCISITTGLGNAFSKGGLLMNFVKFLYKFSSAYAKVVWFLNTDDKELFVKNKIIPEDKSFILPGEGINLNFFKSDIPVHKNGVTTFLLVGRMLYDKGVKVFVEASDILLKKGYSISSLLLGQIDLENPEAISSDTLSKWQKDGLVKYLGPTADVKPFIENADCVVLPSYYKEGIPRVLLEAACMERPIITTENPGCRDIVDDGINGYLCEIKNPKALAEKMEQLVHLSTMQRVNMGKAGRQKMQGKFDETHVINLYLEKCKQYIGIGH